MKALFQSKKAACLFLAVLPIFDLPPVGNFYRDSFCALRTARKNSVLEKKRTVSEQESSLPLSAALLVLHCTQLSELVKRLTALWSARLPPRGGVVRHEGGPEGAVQTLQSMQQTWTILPNHALLTSDCALGGSPVAKPSVEIIQHSRPVDPALLDPAAAYIQVQGHEQHTWSFCFREHNLPALCVRVYCVCACVCACVCVCATTTPRHPVQVVHILPAAAAAAAAGRAPPDESRHSGSFFSRQEVRTCAICHEVRQVQSLFDQSCSILEDS